MKKFIKNKFEVNAKSFSLTKVNPYYDDKAHYLPYRYKDPSFKKKYDGPLMQKDLYILNLMNNRFNASSDKYTFKNRKNLPFINTNQIEISSKKDIVFNSTEYYKNQRRDEYINYSFDKLKKKFFYINPVLLKKQLIEYRKCKYKGIPTYQGKLRNDPKKFLIKFQKQVNENNYLNWEKIKKIHMENEAKRGNKEDKFHDNNKIYEVLGIKNPNPVETEKKKRYHHSNKKHKTMKLSININKLKLYQDNAIFSPNNRKLSIACY